jgi:3-hydroxyisobutyrate dehydrogenase-like beta-hydroxyacid dehydrogenase
MKTRFAVLGLGEAGSLFATDLLAQGIVVCGYDPDQTQQVAGLTRVASIAQAVASADVVLSLNWASVAFEVALEAKAHLPTGVLFADLNTASPKQKAAIAQTLEPVLFADVALLNPVPGNGIRTPALASGNGASLFCQLMQPLGMPAEALSIKAGDAAAHKLVRSVFYKGLAACVGEALEAAKALGCEDWLKENIGATLTGMNHSTVERLVQGSQQHAVRRQQEMLAASQMLTDLGLQPTMAAASAEWLERQKKT